MAKQIDYIGEDGKKYILSISLDSKTTLTFSIRGDESKEKFSSDYELKNLNEKLEKIITFKEISEFEKLLEKNISKKTLILKSPYKNVCNSIWKIFPNDDSKKETFTLMSQKSFNKKISLFFYENFTKSEKFVLEAERQLLLKQKEQIKTETYIQSFYEDNLFIDNMFFLIGKEDNEEKKVNNFINNYNDIIKSKEKENNYEIHSLLVFFDEEENDIVDSLMKIVNKFHKKQIFILILTSNDKDKLNYEIANKVNKLTESKRSYFDMNNIFIYQNSPIELSKSIISLIKVYTYFNQLGSSFYSELQNSDLNIDNLKEELGDIFQTHYFNILLCGRTGSGKSTFINKILGEKKSFTLKTKSAGTYRNNYYIHKKYPIKLIDVCGFAEGSETKDGLAKINAIYNKDSLNIQIDEPSTDTFSFYGDRRNNIHLLLYFNVYNEKYDILPGELPIIKEALKLKIDVIFLINKCPDKIFEDEDEMSDLKGEIEDARKGTGFEKYDTYCINCLTGKGFDLLLSGIYNKYKKYIIKDDDLEKINNKSLSENDFIKLFKDSKFLGNISSKDVFLNDSLIASCTNIKKLIVKIGGYYSSELKLKKSIQFFFKYKLYNNIWRNSEKNFFPLLTDLVKQIYKNFGQEKTIEFCNEFIKKTISMYFSINLEEEKEKKQQKKSNTNSIKKITKVIQSSKKVSDDEIDCCEHYGNMNSNGTKKDDDYNGDDDIGDDNEPAPFNFSFAKFKSDFISLLNLYSDSKNNFRIEEDLEEENLKSKKSINEIVLDKNKDYNIEPRRFYTLIKRDFGLDDSSRDATNNEKIFLKLFYISYVCNELIGNLCGKMNQKNFQYTSIYYFYYTVSNSYNSAIKGFMNICNEIKQKEKELEEYVKFKKSNNSEAPPAVYD